MLKQITAVLLLLSISCATPQSQVGSKSSALTAADFPSYVCSPFFPPAPVPDAGTPPVVDAGTPPVVDAGVPVVDAGTPPVVDAGTPVVDAGTPTVDAGTPVTGWQSLRTSGNRILLPNGSPFQGRGVNIFDTRGCNACAWATPNVAGVKRKIDEAIAWGSNFIRLNMESYPSSGGRVHWANVLSDTTYLAHLKELVDYIGTKPGTYVLLSLWIDPNNTSAPDGNTNGGPTDGSVPVWIKLAQTFADTPHVVFGISNEPRRRTNEVEWAAMKKVVDAIRTAEQPGKKHLIAVQGLQNWGRNLEYYVTRPIEPDSILYETHIYDNQADFTALLAPASTLPVIVGEFGSRDVMTITDAKAMMVYAESKGIPWLAWAFHPRCPPNILASTTDTCGTGAQNVQSPWGIEVRARLGKPYGSGL